MFGCVPTSPTTDYDMDLFISSLTPVQVTKGIAIVVCIPVRDEDEQASWSPPENIYFSVFDGCDTFVIRVLCLYLVWLKPSGSPRFVHPSQRQGFGVAYEASFYPEICFASTWRVMEVGAGTFWQWVTLLCRDSRLSGSYPDTSGVAMINEGEVVCIPPSRWRGVDFCSGARAHVFIFWPFFFFFSFFFCFFFSFFYPSLYSPLFSLSLPTLFVIFFSLALSQSKHILTKI